MSIRFVLDENIRGPLWRAIRSHNSRGIDPIDVLRVGDPADLPCGSTDPEILLWCEREDRILITFDRRTLPGDLASHLGAGHHSPASF